MPKKLFLIDAHAHIYQAYYAIKGLTGPNGEPVNAAYGFARMIRKLCADYAPDYLAAAFDVPGEVFRHEIYKDYKATRKPMPEDLQRQMPLIQHMLAAAGIPQISVQGFEADDVIGSAARQAAREGVQSVLVTTDKDAEQLIDDMTTVLHMHKDKVQMLDAAALKEAKGLEPWQVVELMALAGDSSDNVPGVPGVGPVTALKLIQRFGSVKNLYDHIGEVESESLRRKLIENRDKVEMSRRLVEIDCGAPVQLDLDAAAGALRDREKLNEFYVALGFESLIEEETSQAPAGSPDGDRRPVGPLLPSRPTGRPRAQQSRLFAEAADETAAARLAPGQEGTDYATLRTAQEVRDLAAVLPSRAPFAVDLETTSLEPHQARVVGISVSWRQGQAAYVACEGPKGEQLCPAGEALRALKAVLEDPAVPKVGQNLKYDMNVLRTHGVMLHGAECDTMIADYLLRPDERSHGLDAMALRHLDYRMIQTESLIGTGRNQITMDQAPVEAVARYACEDADVTCRLRAVLLPMIEQQGLLPLLREVEMPLVSVLADMEYVGVAIDQERLCEISREFEQELKEIRRTIYELAGTEFNLNSPRQLSAVLFERLGLPRPRGKERTTGYATDSDVLSDLIESHPIARHLLRWRELSKLKGTYADALAELVNPVTGRLHTSLNQTGTATGRLSSSEPNLQNIPVRTPLGRRIRSAFVPGAPEMSLLSADYSQVELRVLAHCSGDETLRDAFRRGRDIHRFVAAQVAGVNEDEVTDRMRRRAKAVNFGIVYGVSPYGLARQIEMPLEEARRFIDEYFERYPRVREFIGRTVAEARLSGGIRTLAGRWRPVRGLKSSGPVRSAAERIAVNSVIQGSAADLIKIAMIAIHRGLPSVSNSGRMLLQIHDELLFEVPDADLEPVREFVAQKMQGAMKLDVPLKVDVAIGKNWEEAK